MDRALFKRHVDAGFVIFTFKMGYDSAKKNKKMIYMPAWSKIDKPEMSYYNESHNSVAVKTAYEYVSDRYLIMIDIDNKESIMQDGTICKNGYELINIAKNMCDISTISETTPKGGKHLYYYVDKETHDKLMSYSTTASQFSYNGVTYSVDCRYKGGVAYMSPSYYYNDANEKMEYKMDGNYSLCDIDKIAKLPKIFYDMLMERYDKYKNQSAKCAISRQKINCKYNVIDKSGNATFSKKCELKDIKKYVQYIGSYDTYERYRKMAYILKNLNVNAFDIFVEWAKNSAKFNINDATKMWNHKKVDDNININSLIFLVREDKINGYETVLSSINSDNTLFAAHDICVRYLSESIFINEKVEEWINKETFKFLSIKSAYGTGKTTLIRDIIDRYNDKVEKILFITYRRSLADSIATSFREYGFRNYMDGVFDADRQIIQLDSILKLENHHYDMIILDEIEGLISHMSSHTIRNEYGKINNIFRELNEIIEDSKYVLAMDGDYGDRAHLFLTHNQNNDNDITVINNTMHIDPKTMIIYGDPTKINNMSGKQISEYNNSSIALFDDNMKKDIDEGKKIVIICMSANKANEYNNKFTEMYPNKKIKCYTSKSDDNEKSQDLGNVTKSWMCDILIYSPTIESGIDFNVENFDCQYVIYSRNSTCPRALGQMMKRVRVFKENNVHILAAGASINSFATPSIDEIIDNYKFVTQSERLNMLDILRCYNTYEEFASSSNFWGSFAHISRDKGHTFKSIGVNEINEKNINIEKDDDKKSMTAVSIEALLNVGDIGIDQYMSFRGKKLSAYEKLCAEKYRYKKKFFLSDNEFNCEFLKKFYKKMNIFDNHMALINEKYINNYNKKDDKIATKYNIIDGQRVYLDDDDDDNDGTRDYDINAYIAKVRIINQMIKLLGFSKFDGSEKIHYDNIEKNIKDITKCINEYNGVNIKKAKKIETSKALIGKLNGIFHMYGITLKYVYGKRIIINGKYTRIGEYKLMPVNDIDIYVNRAIEHIENINNNVPDCLFDDED